MDSEQPAVVPVGALQQFLAALKAKDFEGAKALAFMSERNHIIPRHRARQHAPSPLALAQS